MSLRNGCFYTLILYIIGGCINGCVLEGKLVVLLICKIHILLTQQFRFQELPGSLMTQMLGHVHKDICTEICAAAVFIIVKNNLHIHVSINRGVVK